MYASPTPQSHITNTDGGCRGRKLKVTTLYRVYGRRESRVPYIRISGKWLAALGFNRDQHVVVQGEPGQLTITVLERAHASEATAG